MDCFALAVAFRGLSCGYCFAPVVCGFLLVCVWFFFPSGGMTKERAHRVGASSLRGLWACYMLRAAFIASSFDFEKIHPAPQVRCALNLPPRAFSVSFIVRVSPITAIAFSE